MVGVVGRAVDEAVGQVHWSGLLVGADGQGRWWGRWFGLLVGAFGWGRWLWPFVTAIGQGRWSGPLVWANDLGQWSGPLVGAVGQSHQTRSGPLVSSFVQGFGLPYFSWPLFMGVGQDH